MAYSASVINQATGQPYANKTVMNQWGDTPSPSRDAAFSQYMTPENGQIFADASNAYQTAYDQYLRTGKGGPWQAEANYLAPEANDLLKSLAGAGWGMNNYGPLDPNGVQFDNYQEGIKFFNDAAKSLGYSGGGSSGITGNAIGTGGNSYGGSYGDGDMRSQGGAAIGTPGFVDPINPQAGSPSDLFSFGQYEDASFQNALGRLDPFLNQQTAQFGQQMANQGIPVGSDAYNKASQQMNLGQTDAINNAAFGAMGFGLGAQNQSFGQDLARSQLANSLLQAQMQNDLGMANVDLGWGNVGLGRDQLAQQNQQFGQELAQQGSQFNDTLGYNYDTFYDTLANNQYQFDTGMGADMYKFDSGLDYDYWNQGNAWDLANSQFDSNEYWNAYNAGPTGATQYDNALLMSLLGMAPPGVVSSDPMSAYNAQVGSGTSMGNNASGQSMDWLWRIADLFGDKGV